MPLFEKIVVLTGAGVSAESGLGTFRDKDGLWTKYDLSKVATPEGYAENPGLVLDFYNMRRKNAREAEHNAAHIALARLEQEFAGEVLIVTQNIDDLHERAGSRNLLHMHGEIFKARCTHCGKGTAWRDDLTLETLCPHCDSKGTMRPDIVWFGEMPMHMEEIYQALSDCDLFVSIGTSGTVYPAAGFVDAVSQIGRAHTVELNLEPSGGYSAFAEVQTGPATTVVPAFVEDILTGG